ncbi:hypothetical protein ACTXT7_000779, partial [Hymenolepis weldensis]
NVLFNFPDECPLDCSGHGHCVKGDDGHYFCQCFANRKGSACQVSREVSCNDGRDDDQGKDKEALAATGAM